MQRRHCDVTAASKVAGWCSGELAAAIPGAARATILFPSPKKMAMIATEVRRELLYPLTDMAIIFAMVFFWLLFGLAQNAGLLGIVLMIILMPAYLRYLLYLLEARANNRSAPVPDMAMFNPADNFWSLAPVVLIAIAIWAGILLVPIISLLGVMLIGVALMVIVPASMAVLAITHSPAESLNPAAILRMVRACGAAYFAVPVVLIAMSCVFAGLYMAGVPLFLIDLATSYQIVLLFTMTGAVLYANKVAVLVDIPDPVEPTTDDLARDLDHERQKVANHAYGFISRGNRQGGFAHIRQWLENEAVVEEAYQWFFHEMLKWESADPALFFAQDYLALLLKRKKDDEALKLIARCLHENARWRPRQEDRDDVNELAARHGRDDLITQMKN